MSNILGAGLENINNMYYFAIPKRDYIMLGIDSKELPVVEGQYATEMREALQRVRTGQLNETDKQIEEYSQRIKKEYAIVWS